MSRRSHCSRHCWPSKTATIGDADPYLWLEEVTGEKALKWVKEANAESIAELTKTPEFKALNERLLKILDSKERIPYIAKRGDSTTTSGATRRTNAGCGGAPRSTSTARPSRSGRRFSTSTRSPRPRRRTGSGTGVWLEPELRPLRWCSSRAAAPTPSVVREFDPKTKTFVKNGFALPEAKSDVAWKDNDTLFVGTDFGHGSLTDSGYPRVIKEWKRGTKLEDAKLVYEGQKTDVAVQRRATTPGIRARLRCPRDHVLGIGPSSAATATLIKIEKPTTPK